MKQFSPVICIIALLASVLVPSIGYACLGTSSMAPGVLFVAALLFTFLLGVDKFDWILKIPENLFYIYFFVAIIAFLLTDAAWMVNENFDLSRFWKSILLMAIVFLGAFSLVELIQKFSDSDIDLSVKFSFWILFFSGLAGVMKFSPFLGEAFSKSVLVFAEPSHFALSFLPFFLYRMVLSSIKIKFIIIISVTLMALFLENLTLIAGIFFIAVVTLPLKKMLFFIPVSLMTFLAFNPDYYIERLNIFDSGQNLSLLVYMQGWERAYLSFRESFGLGLGFQQFGVTTQNIGEIMDNVVALAGEELNLLDGGSLAPKIIGEFGIFGIFAILIYLYYFIKTTRWLRSVSLHKISDGQYKKIFFMSCFVMFCVDLFIRGAGYFSSSGFLFMAALAWIGMEIPAKFIKSTEKAEC